VLALLVTGAGIGLAWPHLSTGVMSSVTDPRRGEQGHRRDQHCPTTRKRVRGLVDRSLVNLGGANPLTSARNLFAGIAAVTALGLITVLAAFDRPCREPTRTTVWPVLNSHGAASCPLSRFAPLSGAPTRPCRWSRVCLIHLYPAAGGRMPGKTRVSILAKELGITSVQAVRELNNLGEHVTSASSTIEAPVAEKLRQRHTAPDRPAPPQPEPRRKYPHNDHSMDLGKEGVDHQPTMRRPAPMPNSPLLLAPLPVKRHRREWWRGDPPGELTYYILDEVIVPDRDEYAKAPPPQYRYFEDEVKRAREISGEWSVCLLQGMDYEEILAWRSKLSDSTLRSFWRGPNNGDDPADVAIRLAAAGIKPHDLEWRYGDEITGTLIDRLSRGTMTVDEVIAEALARRSDADY